MGKCVIRASGEAIDRRAKRERELACLLVQSSHVGSLNLPEDFPLGTDLRLQFLLLPLDRIRIVQLQVAAVRAAKGTENEINMWIAEAKR